MKTNDIPNDAQENQLYVYLAKINNLTKIRDGVYKNASNKHFILTKLGFVNAEQINLLEYIKEKKAEAKTQESILKDREKKIVNLKRIIQDFKITLDVNLENISIDTEVAKLRKLNLTIAQQLKNKAIQKQLFKVEIKEKNKLMNELRHALKNQKEINRSNLAKVPEIQKNEMIVALIDEINFLHKKEHQYLQNAEFEQQEMERLEGKIDQLENYLIQIIFENNGNTPVLNK